MVRMPDVQWFWKHVLDAMWALTIADNWEKIGDVDVTDAVIAASETAESFGSMIGTIFPVAWADIPDNFLECDGSVYERVDYPVLYELLDSFYIIDADTFSVPDLSGRVAVGSSSGFAVGMQGGEIEHTLTEAEMPSHAHIYTPPVFNVDIEAPGAPDPLAAGIGIPTYTASTGGDDPHNNMQPYTVIKYVIAAR